MKSVQLTKEGLEKLKVEYQTLKTTKRPAAVERLQKARGMGDLSENSEYSASREELGLIDNRLQEIELILKTAQVVENNSNHAEVALGSNVTVETQGDKHVFQIVGEFESDPVEKKLSYTSPIGKALLGKRIGQTLEIEIPAGIATYKILDIN